MNIKLDIDATPEELRRFFGLPDVQPLQEAMMEKVRENMTAGMDGFDPMALMKPTAVSTLVDRLCPRRLISKWLFLSCSL